MANHPNFRTTPFTGAVENTEFEFSSLYLHHISSGPSPTQASIVSKDATTGWGSTVVNNWPIYDGVGPDAKLVACAQGLHINAGSWHNTLTIVFETGRYKESTLQVMGTIVEKGQWSITGGTGELAMARGVINKKPHGSTTGGDIIELTIHGFCRRTFTLTKSGPEGGNSGQVVDSEKPWKIESITILHGGVIGTFEYSYIDQTGKKRSAGPWGSKNPRRAEIVLAPGEIITEVSGIVTTYINTIKIVTNKKTYGPYGNPQPNGGPRPYSMVAPAGKSIVGFFGRHDKKFLVALGVYMADI